MTQYDYMSSLNKVLWPFLPTAGFIIIAAILDAMFNEGDIERRADLIMGLACVFYGAVYIYQNR